MCKCWRAGLLSSSATFWEAKMSYNMEQMIQMLFSSTSATCPRCHLVNAICPTCCWASAIWPKCHLSHMPNVPAAKCPKCHWSRPPNVLSAICRGRHLASAKWSNAGQSTATSHSPVENYANAGKKPEAKTTSAYRMVGSCAWWEGSSKKCTEKATYRD